jgi:hypothetical protein
VNVARCSSTYVGLEGPGVNVKIFGNFLSTLACVQMRTNVEKSRLFQWPFWLKVPSWDPMLFSSEWLGDLRSLPGIMAVVCGASCVVLESMLWFLKIYSPKKIAKFNKTNVFSGLSLICPATSFTRLPHLPGYLICSIFFWFQKTFSRIKTKQ